VATYSNKTNSINIYTDSEDAVHVNQVILRDCNDFSRLLELNLYVKVLENTYPSPVTDIRTSYTLSVGDVLTYQIPKLVSPNGNDTPQVYVTQMQDQANNYPPFLMYENATNTIILMPNSTQVQGRTYYFSIVVKNQHSDVIQYPYMCTIKVNGDIINIDNSINYTTINYTINWVSNYKGSIKFNKPVNMTWLEANFNNVFQYYWTNTDYSTNLVQQKFKDFEVTNWGANDSMTVNFTMTFFKPYQIGLLHKKSDLLAFKLKQGYKGNENYYCQLFIGNCTEINMSPNVNATVTKRMEIIFDMRNSVMLTFRHIAANMYYVLIALIVIQFIVLAVRGVGLLPVWILIEYLQLVAFMPLYNFTLIPYLYDAFKPALVTHLIIFDETPMLPILDTQFFNKNYGYYKLSTGRLMQSVVGIGLVFALVVIANLVVFILARTMKER
jgi:hypothetical protein